MYSIIQKIYEKNNKILKEGLKNVLEGADVSSLTGAIKDFTDVLGKELFKEIVTQIENLVFEDSKRKSQYEVVRFAEKSLVTKNGKTTFERRYYKDNETGENVCLTDTILGLEKGERIAQMMFMPVCAACFCVCESLDETERGEGGFGSTGKK